jgi:hypothetical protein
MSSIFYDSKVIHYLNGSQLFKQPIDVHNIPMLSKFTVLYLEVIRVWSENNIEDILKAWDGYDTKAMTGVPDE